MEAPPLFSSGMKPHNMWSEASMMQHIMPFRYQHEEQFVEQSAENVPEGSTPDSNQKNAGNSALNSSSPTFKECYHVPFGFAHPPIANMNTGDGNPAVVEVRMTPSGPKEKLGSAPLTIFYGGNVNVFNDVSVEMANAIMLLASRVDSKCNPHMFSNATRSMGARDVHEKSSANLCEPVVPRYLPQAQKASLARFLEKRRERMLSKSPYALKTADPSFPEETLSSSNDVFTYKTVRRNESSSPICK